MQLSRRKFLVTGTALATAPILGAPMQLANAGVSRHRLTASAASIPLLGADAPDTQVLAYNGSVPGPILRFRRGERVELDFDNALDRPTTVHWHGLRVPNDMDGVPMLTQAPVAPGGRFRYAFELRNTGTYWYHPHFQSAEQLDRGLHGVIIVEDDDPPRVDRDLLWVLDDWRLDAKGQIVGDFGNLHDASHQGRFGNTASVNGSVSKDLRVQAGERIRLRLVNVANAWIFGLDFVAHSPTVIAYDGHAVAPHRPPDGLVIVGPSQRVDIILDLGGAPGERFEVLDRYFSSQQYKLLDLVYGEDRLRSNPPGDKIALPAPDLAAPNLTRAERHEITFSGGAMGGMKSARLAGQETGIRELAQKGKVWAINGTAASRHDEPPVLQLARGHSYIMDFVNETAFSHPIHLHGHPMMVLEANGEVPAQVTWRDTLLLDPRSRASVAMVADNPGRWMLHCHIPEHQEAGMMAVVQVD
jgi:FtsP/CotA-like multicopper oxidase with cupredoxin domain